jgi:long-chain acyl-CoA synthetase
VNLASLVDGHPADGRAVFDGGTWHTWGELRRRSTAAAAGLVELGVGAGDRVAIAWPTSIDFVVAYLAVLAVGAVAVPLNPNSPVLELAREIEVVTPAALLAGGAAGDGAAELDQALTVSLLMVLPATARSANARSATVRPSPTGSATGSAGVEVPSWEEMSSPPTGPTGPTGSVAGADADADAGADADADADADGSLAAVSRDDDDIAVLLFTSGTSGSPKAAMLSHGNLVANLRQMLALPGEIVRADDVSLAAMPLFHVFGLNVALGLSLASGAAIVLEERFDPVETLRIVRDLGVTNLLGVPTMFSAWVALAEDDPTAAGAAGTAGTPSTAGPSGLSGVRRAISGAASLPAEVAERFERAFGVPVWQGYGLTEAAPAVSTSLGTGRNRAGSVGLPLPGVSVRLVDGAGEDVLAGDPGEIWVEGPNVFAGYWRDPEASAEALSPTGWLRTGDVGVIGEEGDLFIVDRSKDLLIVSGFNVYPAEVEEVVGSVPGVEEAVVVGRSDPATGESVEVVIVVADGARVTQEQVRDHCASRLARYKCPTTVRFVSELPHGLAGKALRRALREQSA